MLPTPAEGKQAGEGRLQEFRYVYRIGSDKTLLEGLKPEGNPQQKQSDALALGTSNGCLQRTQYPEREGDERRRVSPVDIGHAETHRGRIPDHDLFKALQIAG